MKLSPLMAPETLSQLRGEVVLLDARQSRADYERGHLPGARHADLNRDLSRADAPGFDPAVGGRHPLPDPATFARTLGEWGIGPGTRVVIYDAAQGANAAARAWWMLRSVGHEAVQVLDGGLPAALDAGMSLTADRPAIEPKAAYPASGWRWPTSDVEFVERAARDSAWRVLDVRSAERYRGGPDPFDPRPGHIAGAVNLPYAMNLQENGQFRPREELKRMYEQLLGGLRPDRLVVHCGSGVTACHTLLALEHAGLSGASLYVGSYSEWTRSGRPVATGEAP